ncbi:MAG: ATP-binding cassette domain-containing protein [Chromatiaceae bacterium]|jgi:putative ABC transport system ATP-binding protein|nr:ATP-binding cassette domain-containing protein [Chromatiaceae bacterium]
MQSDSARTATMIQIEGLHKTFNPNTANAVYALRGVDLELATGDFVTVIGTNGSGKSTLLNAVAGNFLPDQGSIRIAGERLTRQPDFRRAHLIARVFQNPFMGTAPNMSIAENLLLAHLRGHPRRPRVSLDDGLREQLAERVRSLEMGLEGRLDNLIGSLSGGQRQALTLLMAVLREPKVLLLDEHTAALDPKSAAQVIRLTQNFVEAAGLTTLMVTHSMHQALTLGNRTIMMHQGRIVEALDVEDKQRLGVDDLLHRFTELRKREQLTEALCRELVDAYR